MKLQIILISLFFLLFGSACTIHSHPRSGWYYEAYAPPPPPPRVVHHHETVYVHKRPPRRVVRHEHYVHHYHKPARYHRPHYSETRRPPRDRGYRRHDSFYRSVSRDFVRKPARHYARPSTRYHDGKRHKKDRHDKRKDRRRHKRR